MPKNAERVKLGKRSKTKGNAFEREVAHLFQEAYGEALVRTPQSGGFVRKSQTASDFRGDIVPADDDVELKLHVEVKNCKQLSPKQWINQSESDCPVNRVPVVIFHQHQSSNNFIMLRNADMNNLVPDYEGVLFKQYSQKSLRLIHWFKEVSSLKPQSKIAGIKFYCYNKGTTRVQYVLFDLMDFFKLVPKDRVISKGV